MNVDQLSLFKSQILTALEKIDAQNLALRKEIIQTSQTQTGISQNFFDHAQNEAELQTQLEIHQRLTKNRDQLLIALKRIEQKTFGICTQCEEEIDLKRLSVCPAATQCIACQSNHEPKSHPSKTNSIAFPALDLNAA